MHKLLVCALLPATLLLARAGRAQVGIGTTTPNAKAALDIQSPTNGTGLLIPRLSEAQRLAITAPPQGLMVYQTDGTTSGGTQTGFWYYAGAPAAWVFLNPTPASSLTLPYSGTVSTSSPAFAVTNTGTGQALSGSTASSTSSVPAVLGQNTNTTSGTSTGVLGTTVSGFGVRGTASGSGGYGVTGQGTDSYGVVGLSNSGVGTYGSSRTGVSVQGLKFGGDQGRVGEFLNSDVANDSTALYVSTPGDRPAIRAVNTAPSAQAAIRGVKQTGSGGIGLEGIAGSGTTGSATGVLGRDLSGTTTGSGVVGRTTTGYGVQGIATGTNGYGMSASATSGTALLASSSSGLAIDATSGAIRTTELRSPSTGTTNMMPICYGNVGSNGAINTVGSASNFTVTRLGTGIYDITITGENYFYLNYTTVASLNASGGEISTNSINGLRLRVYTFTSTGVLADRDFCFVTYKP